MKRYVSLDEISDGKLYGLNDMVKADCHGCTNCSKCCRGMGHSIILDPYDCYQMTLGLRCTFTQLLESQLELNVVDGIILPNIKMTNQDCCSFLNQEGRCSIHSFRPGICRIFPLGRYYQEEGFRYFLQTAECTQSHTKIKVSKWIDTPNLKQNQEYIMSWHQLQSFVENLLQQKDNNDFHKEITMDLLKQFYLLPYDEKIDFYSQFEERLKVFTYQYKCDKI